MVYELLYRALNELEVDELVGDIVSLLDKVCSSI